ncbi:hypothetical protein O3P69_002196 [Scylla paramamosain]|uniref:Uncharacterized protein n=1 Tax=Scylla paramamosain TaxID=85552 RepID=A0AAW0V8B5_SCYPA
MFVMCVAREGEAHGGVAGVRCRAERVLVGSTGLRLQCASSSCAVRTQLPVYPHSPRSTHNLCLSAVTPETQPRCAPRERVWMCGGHAGRTPPVSVSGLHVLVIVLAAVLVTALLSCVLGHSKMGARLWSHRRSARAAHTTPASRHTHTTIITPTTFTHSVLYVCEGMNNSMGDAMAAHARDRSTRYQSVQQDTTLGFPYQVQRPDGEERYPSKKPHPAPDQEILREYIKPPANKTLSDVNVNGPHHSCSVGGFPTQPECGLGHSGIHSYRYSAPLDAQSPHSAVGGTDAHKDQSSWDQLLLQWMKESPVPGVPRTSAMVSGSSDGVWCMAMAVGVWLGNL